MNVFDSVSGKKPPDCRAVDYQRSFILCQVRFFNLFHNQKVMMRCFPADESDFESDLYSCYFVAIL